MNRSSASKTRAASVRQENIQTEVSVPAWSVWLVDTVLCRARLLAETALLANTKTALLLLIAVNVVPVKWANDNRANRARRDTVKQEYPASQGRISLMPVAMTHNDVCRVDQGAIPAAWTR